MTNKEKMEAGLLYDSNDPALAELRQKAHALALRYNTLPETAEEERKAILRELTPDSGEIYLQGPIQFDYGYLTTFGEGSYANFNLTILDCCPVTIGKNVLFGPNCSIVTPVHPLLPEERNPQIDENGNVQFLEYAKPITIGDNCWLGTAVTVCGGVTIGEGTVIGAGSVVVKDIPSGVFAAGNPCRVIRKLTEADRLFGKENG